MRKPERYFVSRRNRELESRNFSFDGKKNIRDRITISLLVTKELSQSIFELYKIKIYMKEIVIQPRRRTFVKALIVLFSILSVVGVTFFIYSRQVLDKTTVINGVAVPPEPAP